MTRTQALTGQPAPAANRLQQAQRQLAQVAEPSAMLRVECLLAEGLVELARPDNERATALLEQASGILKARGLPDRAAYGEVLSYLAMAYLQNNKPAAAIAVTLESAQIEQELGMTDTIDHLHTMQNLAALWFQVGEIGRAAADRERIGQLSGKFYSTQNLDPVLIYNGAVTLLRMERPQEALATLDGKLERFREAGNPALLLKLLHAKAWTHTQLSEWAAAEEVLAEAQPLVEQGAGNSALDGQLEALRADIAVARKDAAAAHEHMEKALAIAGYPNGLRERAVARLLITASELALAAGQAAVAERYARDALSMSEEITRGPDTSADVGESLLMLAKSMPRNTSLAELHNILQRAVRCLSTGLDPQHRLTREARGMLERL